MLWYVDPEDFEIVRDATNRLICMAQNPHLAVKIVLDHNQGDFLTEDQKDAIRNERREKSNDFGSSYRD